LFENVSLSFDPKVAVIAGMWWGPDLVLPTQPSARTRLSPVLQKCILGCKRVLDTGSEFLFLLFLRYYSYLDKLAYFISENSFLDF
jgi:hypothetical protein